MTTPPRDLVAFRNALLDHLERIGSWDQRATEERLREANLHDPDVLIVLMEEELVEFWPDAPSGARSYVGPIGSGYQAPEEPVFALEERYWRKLAQALLVDLGGASIPYVDRHGRYADVHALRHTFATTAGEVAEDLATLQAMTRHKTASMALRYAHTDSAKMRRAATRLGLELGQLRERGRTPADDNGASQDQDAASAS
jgi:hypothetical protein